MKTEINKFGTIRKFKDGMLHCEDGPAVIYADGTKLFCLEGVILSEVHWFEIVGFRRLKRERQEIFNEMFPPATYA